MLKLFNNVGLKRKYNTLELKYEVLREDLERKQLELNTEKKIHKQEKEIWEEKLKKQEEEIIKLKRKLKNDSNNKK